jgi:hypothetical protein
MCWFVRVTLSGSSMKTDEWPNRKERDEADLYETSTIPADVRQISEFSVGLAMLADTSVLLMTRKCVSSQKFASISDPLSPVWCLLCVTKSCCRFTGLRPNISQIQSTGKCEVTILIVH